MASHCWGLPYCQDGLPFSLENLPGPGPALEHVNQGCCDPEGPISECPPSLLSCSVQSPLPSPPWAPGTLTETHGLL